MLQVKYYLGFLLFFYLNNKGSQLKVIATMSVGYDHIDVEAAKARCILIGYTPDVLTDATADLTLLLILGAARRIKEGIQAAEHGQVKKKNITQTHVPLTPYSVERVASDLVMWFPAHKQDSRYCRFGPYR